MSPQTFGFTEDEIKALVTGSELPIALLVFERCSEVLQFLREIGGDDSASILLLGELIQRATLGFRRRLWTTNRDMLRFAAEHRPRFASVHSLATVTGLPRESVRRKIDAFVQRGWATRNNKGAVALSVKTIWRLLEPEQIGNSTVGALKAADELLSLLSRKQQTLAQPRR